MIEVFHMSEDEGEEGSVAVASVVKNNLQFVDFPSSSKPLTANAADCRSEVHLSKEEDSGGLYKQYDHNGLSNKANNNLSPILDFNSVACDSLPPSPSPKLRDKRRHRPQSFSTCFADCYDFTEEVLGMGAQGVVCTCIHKVSKLEYAVKLINKHIHPDRQRVFKEMDLFYTCRNCKYILKLHEYFEDDTYFYLVFDKMYGGQLLHHILRRGHLNEREASIVTGQIAEALDYMHGKGLAHRDLKPENILCQSETELLPIKLCDFDLASAIRHAGTSTMTTPALSTPVGSAEFMAPEVVDAWVLERDKGDFVNYDKRCDLWSLGVIVYIMLCGYPPFYGRCGQEQCNWEDGKYCRDCQQLLFNRIRDGEFSFPSPEWDDISDDAKDLISHLLVCDSRVRYSAGQVLQHPWIKCAPPKTALVTASVLQQDNSVRSVENFTNEAMSISKLIDVQLTNGHDISLPPETSLYPNRNPIDVLLQSNTLSKQLMMQHDAEHSSSLTVKSSLNQRSTDHNPRSITRSSNDTLVCDAIDDSDSLISPFQLTSHLLPMSNTDLDEVHLCRRPDEHIRDKENTNQKQLIVRANEAQLKTTKSADLLGKGSNNSHNTLTTPDRNCCNHQSNTSTCRDATHCKRGTQSREALRNTVNMAATASDQTSGCSNGTNARFSSFLRANTSPKLFKRDEKPHLISFGGSSCGLEYRRELNAVKASKGDETLRMPTSITMKSSMDRMLSVNGQTNNEQKSSEYNCIQFPTSFYFYAGENDRFADNENDFSSGAHRFDWTFSDLFEPSDTVDFF